MWDRWDFPSKVTLFPNLTFRITMYRYVKNKHLITSPQARESAHLLIERLRQ